MKLLDKVHLQRAADTAIRECQQTIVFLVHYSALLNQVGIDIHFTYIVDNHGKTNTFLVGENAIKQRGLAASKITR